MNIKTLYIALILCLLPFHAAAQNLPIIDMHLHASRLADFEPFTGPALIPHCIPMTDYPVPESGSHWAEVFRSRNLPCHATWSPETDEQVMVRSLEIMELRNIIGVTSGPLLDRWREAAPERLIPSLSFQGGPGAPSTDE